MDNGICLKHVFYEIWKFLTHIKIKIVIRTSCMQVITALRFFASGSYQMDIGRNIYMAVSQPTVSRCVNEVINVITREEVMNQWIRFPNTLAELNELRTQYKYILYCLYIHIKYVSTQVKQIIM